MMTDKDWKIYGRIVARYPDYFKDYSKMENIDELLNGDQLNDTEREVLAKQVERIRYAGTYSREYDRHLAGRGGMPQTLDERKFGKTVRPSTAARKISITRSDIAEMGF